MKTNLSFLTLLLAVALAAPLFAPYSPTLGDLALANLPPSLSPRATPPTTPPATEPDTTASAAHFLGTDLLGRDLFSRLLYALRNSLILGSAASALALGLALAYALAGQLLAPVPPAKALLGRLLDLILALPSMVLLLFCQSLFEGGVGALILLIALTHFAYAAKLIWGEFDRIRSLDFFRACLLTGHNPLNALIIEAAPVCRSLITVLLILNLIHAIAAEATLGFLGLGPGPATPSLGMLLNESLPALLAGAWWLFAFPLAALLVLLASLFALASQLQISWGVSA